MAATKKAAAKKTPAVRKPRAAKEPVFKNNVFYVISERSKLFLWTPIEVFENRTEAEAAKAAYEATSPYATKGYKIDRVILKGNGA